MKTHSPLQEGVMDTGRPNHNLIDLASAAIDIASRQSRRAAVEFLFERGVAPEMIAQILAARSAGQCPTTVYSVR